jgi:hypothetical protein
MEVRSFFAVYPQLRQALSCEPPLAELGPGAPREELRPRLAALDLAAIFPHRQVRDEALARCCLSGLWLAYDFLDESHALSQEIHTPEGSYWHGIMHRREPDYSNAKYWFARVPSHPIYDSVAAAAREVCAAEGEADPAADFLARRQPWSPAAFVDLCAAIASGKATCAPLARKVALAEWRLLFDHCYAGAVG